MYLLFLDIITMRLHVLKVLSNPFKQISGRALLIISYALPVLELPVSQYPLLL